MKLQIRLLILLALLPYFTPLVAQSDIGVYKQPGFRDFAYDSDIKTSRIFRTGNIMSDPVIKLRSNETLTLMFDDLSGDSRRFYYNIVHCDADWKEDNLILNEYMTGFPEIQLNEFNYSYNTMVSYNNVSLILPNNDVQLKISGNYLIKIFDDATREIVLQKGFSIVENIAQITANMRNTGSNSQRGLQQIEFKVAHSSLRVSDAFNELKVRIEQNSTRVSGVDNPVPTFTQPGITDYKRLDKNLFPGNNEFRVFDIRNNSFNGMGVSNIRLERGTHRILLTEDKINTLRYLSAKDNNGKYLIGASMVEDADIEGDYSDVFFTLVCNKFTNGRVFLMSEFTDWNIDNRYEMAYNTEMNQYETNLLLKQGYYNYRYVLLNDDGSVDSTPIEGNFADTENNYNMYVYHRSFANNYDRLIGFSVINSNTVYK